MRGRSGHLPRPLPALPAISTHAPVRGRSRHSRRSGPQRPISTHAPVRGRSSTAYMIAPYNTISTHAPVRGRSRDLLRTDCTDEEFLLTPPCGGDPADQHGDRRHCDFYSRPRAGAILCWYTPVRTRAGFLLTPPCGGDPISSDVSGGGTTFLLTPPCGGDRQSSTKQMSCSAANCRKITCFFMGSAPRTHEALPKTAQSAGIDRADLP